MRIGRALSEIINLFVRVDLGRIELIYRYGINDPYERMKNRTLKFPNKKLWSKIIGADIIISQGKPVEDSE